MTEKGDDWVNTTEHEKFTKIKEKSWKHGPQTRADREREEIENLLTCFAPHEHCIVLQKAQCLQYQTSLISFFVRTKRYNMDLHSQVINEFELCKKSFNYSS